MLSVLEVLGVRQAQRSVLLGAVVGQAEQAALVQHSGLVDLVVLAAALLGLFHCV